MIHFGSRIEMLADKYLLTEMNNVSFRKTEPKSLGKVIGFDQPWEGLGSLGMTIFEDDENIKCYSCPCMLTQTAAPSLQNR